MKEKISRLSGHVIICGYQRVGREVARVFKDEGVPLVALDVKDEAIARATRDDMLCVQGDATRDEILHQAGITRARALVAAMGRDTDNVYVTLSAKSINPDILVVARVSDEESESKLKRAGADRVISPYRIAGRRMALLAVRPLVVDFIDTSLESQGQEFMLENIRVDAGSPSAGGDVRAALECCGALAILAIKKADGPIVANPADDILITSGDELVALGTREQLKMLEGSGK